jgi:beta-glucanase (GH16 family)
MHRTRAFLLALVGVLTTSAFNMASASTRHGVHPRKKAHRPRHRSGAWRPAYAFVPRLTWGDEFGGRAGTAPNSSRWQVIYGGGGFGNRELQYYTRRSSNIALDGRGHLVITALRGRYRGRDGVTRSYTSAAIQTKGRFNVMYGRLEARIEIPQGKGLWPAFWAVGGNVNNVGWPRSGEIDMMENVGNDPFTIYGSIHGPERGRPNGYAISARKRTSRSLAGGFHVYGITWSPNKLVFTLDGHRYATDTRSTLAGGQQWAFNHPFFLILNLAVGGRWPGSPDASTPFPAKMLVDWVRVYG